MQVLVAESEKPYREALCVQIRNFGHIVATAETNSHLIRHLEEGSVECLFLGVDNGRGQTLQALEWVRRMRRHLPVIAMASQASIADAVNIIRAGASEYVVKPMPHDEVRKLLTRYEVEMQDRAQLSDLESHNASKNPLLDLTSEQPEMNSLYDMAFRAADSDMTILLLGSSGTGKTILARNIHERSHRSKKPFVTVNCPSLKPELLESELFGHVKGAFTGAIRDTWGKVSAAEGGTLFLDEIGDIPPEIQSRLLRLLQEHRYERVGETKQYSADIRMIAATNRNLEKAVKRGHFREDLYYRINPMMLHMLPLRQRPLDIPRLIDLYLGFFARRRGKPNLKFSDEAYVSLMTYNWPGNLRELRNVVERCVILSDDPEYVDVALLPDKIHRSEEILATPGTPISLQELEEAHIRQILATTESKEEAASILGIDTATLYRKRKRMGLI